MLDDSGGTKPAATACFLLVRFLCCLSCPSCVFILSSLSCLASGNIIMQESSPQAAMCNFQCLQESWMLSCSEWATTPFACEGVALSRGAASLNVQRVKWRDQMSGEHSSSKIKRKLKRGQEDMLVSSPFLVHVSVRAEFSMTNVQQALKF